MNVKKYTEEYFDQCRVILAEEEQALSELRDDLSNADFTVGERNPTTKVLVIIFLFIGLLVGKNTISSVYENDMQMGDYVVLAMAGFLGILAVYQFLYQKLKRKIRICEKTMFYGRKCWTADQIDRLQCNERGMIQVIVNGRPAAKTNLADENSGRLIAWAKKCIIRVDNAYRQPERMKKRREL